MTEYGRGGQDVNTVYPSNQLGVPTYPNGHPINYYSTTGQMSYPHMTPSYSSYPVPFIPSQNQSASSMYMSGNNGQGVPYHIQPRGSELSPQARSQSQNAYYSTQQQQQQTQRPANQNLRFPIVHETVLADTEEQESTNEDTMRSEPVIPPLEGFPDVRRFDEVINQCDPLECFTHQMLTMRSYVAHLSPKKQDKALIHAKRAANIKAVLVDKKTTSVESAQFRFWVKKMFTLHPNDPSVSSRRKKICHENKPVAIREKLFKILTRAHKQCQHGGRDKTSAQVRRVYSWVPKELISRFVKICPTCQVRRGTSRNSPPNSERSVGNYVDGQSPNSISPSHSRRGSVATNRSSSLQSPMQMSGFSSAFRQQNRWMTPLQATDTANSDRMEGIEDEASVIANMQNTPNLNDLGSSQTRYGVNDSDSMHGMQTTAPFSHASVPQTHYSQMSNAQYRYKPESRYRQYSHPYWKQENHY